MSELLVFLGFIIFGLFMVLPYAIYSDTQVALAKAKQQKKCKKCEDC